jgi:hypothetical protein
MTHDSRHHAHTHPRRTAAATPVHDGARRTQAGVPRTGQRAQALVDSPRQRAQARTLSSLTGGTPVVVQRESKVTSEAKLSFFVDEMATQAKARFTNATEDQLDAFRMYVNASWSAKYSPKAAFDKTAARAAWKPAECLRLLGKGKPEQDHFKWLSDALDQTFSDDTDNSYGIFSRPPAKMDQFPPSSDPWLDQLNGEGLIQPEDKTGDQRLKTCAQDNIVKTLADSADTATALYEIDHKQSDEPEIKGRDGTWELHAHVRQNGGVDFAHTKRDAKHASTVNEWFKSHIPATDREWK